LRCLIPPGRNGGFAAGADGGTVADGGERVATFVAVLHYGLWC
jgi:hypothetical protein